MPLLFSKRSRFSRGALWWSVAAPWMALAQAASTTDDPPVSDEPLPPITVQGTPMMRSRETQPDPTRPVTTIGPQSLDRRQPDTLFDVLDEVPGVAVNGGPRAAGMGFNIRGYTDNEDVAVQLDGVAKGFEKYRFGGTFIEPDLLKSIEVRRGASIENAGALGGAVSATTKDGSDLLRPGQTVGGRLRAGWASNNQERSTFTALYGLASDTVDWVAAHTERRGDDHKLPNGQRLALSSTEADSTLLKARWFPNDAWQLGASWIGYGDQGLQPYDAADGGFGKVVRRIRDDTLSLRAQWQDSERGHQWRLTVGQSRTQVHDHMPKGYSVFSGMFDTDDDLRYENNTLDTQATVRLMKGPAHQIDLRMGLQGGQQRRTVTRVTSNEAWNQSQYPGGFNRAQPSGAKDTMGLYLQPDWRWGRLQVMPGVRWDQVSLQAAGLTVSALEQAGQATKVTYRRPPPRRNLAFHLVPPRWTTFAQVGQAFRPPLIDEVFTQQGYGRCVDQILTGLTSGGYLPGYSSDHQRVAPSSGICGDLYRPETSRSVEWGLSLRQPRFLGAGFQPMNRLSAKLTFFRNRTDHLLESLYAQSGGSGLIVQEGWERRHGIELEASAEVGPAFLSLAASRIRGDAFDGRHPQALSSAPADRGPVTLGWRWTAVEAALRWQQVSSRLTNIGGTALTPIHGQQGGYHLLGASLRWNLNPHVALNLSGENLRNATYHLNNGFGNGQGSEAPGRNVRVSLTTLY